MTLNLKTTFHEFKLNGANINRFFIVYVDNKAIVTNFRKQALDEKIQAKKKRTNFLYGIGQTPLLLIDGNPSPEAVQKAMTDFGVSWWIALCRHIDIKLKKDLKQLHKRIGIKGGGLIDENGEPAEWLLQYLNRYETEENEEIKVQIYSLIKDYLQYEEAKQRYHEETMLPVYDLMADRQIGGQVGDIVTDINEYIYKLAQEKYPVGVENIIQKNIKMKTIINHKWFLSEKPPPNVKSEVGQSLQLDLFNWAESSVSVEDTINKLVESIEPQLDDGFRVTDMMAYLAEIGIYESDIALYVMGKALAQITDEYTIHFNGMAYFKYCEQLDISNLIVGQYKKRLLLKQKHREDILFRDTTRMKEKIQYLFGLEDNRGERPIYDTFGFTLLDAKIWVRDNLKYPIAFLDGKIYEMFRSNTLYGKELQHFDAYFSLDKCKELKSKLPESDRLAAMEIKAATGINPETTPHGMVGTMGIKGHWYTVLYSKDNFLEEMVKEKPIWCKERVGGAA